jgi:hypothetical protein
MLAAGAVFVAVFFEKGVLATPRNPEVEVAAAHTAPTPA